MLSSMCKERLIGCHEAQPLCTSDLGILYLPSMCMHGQGNAVPIAWVAILTAHTECRLMHCTRLPANAACGSLAFFYPVAFPLAVAPAEPGNQAALAPHVAIVSLQALACRLVLPALINHAF